MPEIPNRYKFDTIFSYNPIIGIIIPQFTVILNMTRFNKGISINRYTIFNGLNLFNYIGRDIAGYWNLETKELTIIGFY